jgi:hypothetical protein
MSAIGAGFDALQAACDLHGIAAEFGRPRPDAPAAVLGQPLEPTLHALYREHDGAWWSSPEFSLRIYPLDGPDALEWRNTSLRHSAADFTPPYSFDDLLSFAQYGRQASCLVTIPSLVDDSGAQPVLYLDVHEDPWAVPIASSVDRAFAVIAQYLNRAAGKVDVTFPYAVRDVIEPDERLATLMRSNAFARWIARERV